MSLSIIVLVKQVPDTQNISQNAMKQDGTVNRDALPAIFNPEDLNALEEGLRIKDLQEAKLSVISMGPAQATEVLRESLYRGTDDAILLSDRKFAGADTLATSYALKCAVQKLGKFDLVLCGRQAIDGDTGQVGPQLAEKLGINQVTSVCAPLCFQNREIRAVRSTELGYEKVRTQLPVLLTISSEANDPRPPSAKKVLAYKDIQAFPEDEYENSFRHTCSKNAGIIRQWDMDFIGADPEKCGLKGSKTWVKKIQNVVLAAREPKQIENTQDGISLLIQELTQEHIIG